MPFVTVHLSSGSSVNHPALAGDIRAALVETLDIKPDHGHVVLCETKRDFRSTHESRDPDFVFVQIVMFSGRTDRMKEALFKRLNDIIHDYTGVPERDILLVILESERKNWAGRGGIPVSRLDLGY